MHTGSFTVSYRHYTDVFLADSTPDCQLTFANRFERSAGRSRKRKLLLPRHATHREPVVAIVVVGRIETAAIDVQVVRVVSAIDRRRPIVAVVAAIVKRATVDVACAH